jgi:hypothetical protein
MISGAFFLALAIAAAALRMGDLAAASGLIAVGIGWRPVAARIHAGKIVRLVSRSVMAVAERRGRRRGAASFRPLSREAVRRIAGRGVASSRGPAIGGRPGLRADSGGANGRVTAKRSPD